MDVIGLLGVLLIQARKAAKRLTPSLAACIDELESAAGFFVSDVVKRLILTRGRRIAVTVYGQQEASLPMRCIKLTLAYDGTAYAGWQSQPERATVQGTLETAIEKIVGHPARTLASGRTDAGVHALGQVATFHTDSPLAVDVLRRALNAELPHDVAVLAAEEMPAGFHPIRDALRNAIAT